jgi:hypothetical protein
MRDLLAPDDARDALRAVGALLFGIGVFVLSARKDDPGGFVENDGWGHGALFFLYLLPVVLLYGGAVLTIRDTGGLRPWQAVASVLGLLFVPLALSEFVSLVDGDPSAPLNVTWIALATAACAAYAGLSAGVRFQLLAGSIALLVAYLAFWDELLSDGVFSDLGTLRGLLGLFAIALLAGGLFLWRRYQDGLWKASELLTGAGIAAVAATVGISLTGVLIEAVAGLFGAFGAEPAGGASPTAFWDLLGLLIAVGLILIGTLIGTRGPVYVGAIGLALFAFLVGGNYDADPADRTNGVGGWPILLLILGAAGIGLSLVREASLGGGPRRFVENLRRG